MKKCQQAHRFALNVAKTHKITLLLKHFLANPFIFSQFKLEEDSRIFLLHRYVQTWLFLRLLLWPSDDSVYFNKLNYMKKNYRLMRILYFKSYFAFSQKNATYFLDKMWQTRPLCSSTYVLHSNRLGSFGVKAIRVMSFSFLVFSVRAAAGIPISL